MNDQYPDTTPKLTCQSPFAFPSLFDNRNLIKEVSGYSNKGKCSFSSIITNDIPELIRRYSNDIANKIYSFIGEYRLERLYVINDFATNESNSFYKVALNSVSNYLIMTDIALLFLTPYEKRMEKGKLFLVIEIKDIKEPLIVESKETLVTIKLILIEGLAPVSYDNLGDKVIAFKKDKYESFEKKLIERIWKIKGMFTLFQKDNMNISKKQYDYTQDEGIEELISYKENILSQITTPNNSSDNDNNNNATANEANKNSTKKQIIRDLIELYQKAIEIYSAKCDPQYKSYINILRLFVEKNGDGL